MNHPNRLITGVVLRNRNTGEQYRGDLFTFGDAWIVNIENNSFEVTPGESPVECILWYTGATPHFARRNVFVFDITGVNREWGLNVAAQEYIKAAPHRGDGSRTAQVTAALNLLAVVMTELQNTNPLLGNIKRDIVSVARILERAIA